MMDAAEQLRDLAATRSDFFIARVTKIADTTHVNLDIAESVPTMSGYIGRGVGDLVIVLRSPMGLLVFGKVAAPDPLA